MVELSREIKIVVDDKAKYTDWATRDDIKANLQVDLILLLDKYGYRRLRLMMYIKKYGTGRKL